MFILDVIEDNTTIISNNDQNATNECSSQNEPNPLVENTLSGGTGELHDNCFESPYFVTSLAQSFSNTQPTIERNFGNFFITSHCFAVQNYFEKNIPIGEDCFEFPDLSHPPTTQSYLEEEESVLVDSDADPEYSPSDVQSTDSSSSDTGIDLYNESTNHQTLVQEKNDGMVPSKVKKRKIVTTKSNPGRKRSRNIDEWIDVKAKKSLNQGIEHKNRSGKTITCRSIRPACKTSCRQKCQERLTEDQRKSIFTAFWALSDHTRQWDFIARCVKTVEKKQVTVGANISRRKCSRKYYFKLDNVEKVVCKTMFLNTLGVSEMYVTTTLKKLSSGNNITIISDQRGRHTNRANRIDPEVKESVREHIKLFPLVPSHYIRKNSKRLYLEKGLSIRKMFRLYQEWANGNQIKIKATERQYRDIFTSEFNIGFHKPKKDQCETCNAYEMANEQLKSELQSNYENHQKNKDAVRALKDSDKELGLNDKTILVACFDLQKVLITPMSEVSVFYYKSKYATYNFTVYDVGNNKGFCYTWHEQISGRGPHEVASCLLDFIKLHATKGIKRFIFYSDNCGGQNRNRFLFSMFNCAANSLKVDITHRFLEKGHTQNEGDSMHAVIENAKKRQTAIYTPDQWVTLIRMAKTTGKPYVVKEMGQENFFSTKGLVEKQNWKTDNTHNKVSISKIREIHFSYANPNTVTFRYLYGDELKTLNLRKEMRGRPPILHIEDLPQLYTKFLPIEKKKLQGLLSLCASNNIPSMYHAFYKSLSAKGDNTTRTNISAKEPKTGTKSIKNDEKDKGNSSEEDFPDEENAEDYDIFY